MFDEHFSENKEQAPESGGGFDLAGLKKIFKLALFVILALVLIGVLAYFVLSAKPKPKTSNSQPVAGNTPAAANLGQLATSSVITPDKSGDFTVEEVSFQKFYQAPTNTVAVKIDDYSLPINIKTDVANYYDVSRKLNLDPGLALLNRNGFAILDNPDPANNGDFYSSYAWLESKGLPILVSVDFLTDYYQNSLKLSFKYLEENLFYNSLRQISKELFEKARARYETRRAKIGDTNDQVLEGERLELAYFAVALQLLKPQTGQISADANSSSGTFTAAEASDLDFVLPAYLQDDVAHEVQLIRAANATTKSPVLLYSRNYQDFVIPYEYRANPRLNNFYLTAKWLNSVFPLYYQGADCPQCQLDQNDWQVNLAAASFVVHDFSGSYEVRNQWARIYKTLSFFKGLRGDLTYTDYERVLTSSFGDNYDLEAVLGAENTHANDNFSKLRTNLLALSFPDWSGGYDRHDLALRPQIGFRVLTDFYSANDYITKQLTAPQVGAYQGKSLSLATLCNQGKGRCKIMSLDIINLLFSVTEPLWLDNINYQGFTANFLALKDMVKQLTAWQSSNYWSNLGFIRSYLNTPKENLPIFGRNAAWQKRETDAGQAFWVNLQSPPDLVKVLETNSLTQNQDLQGIGYYYVEPNLALVNDLTADSQMILGMYRALKIDIEAPAAYTQIENMSQNLEAIQPMVDKELTGQPLSVEDSAFLGKLVNKYQVTSKNPGQLNFGPTSLNYQFGAPKFLILTFNVRGQKAFTIGPVFFYSVNK